MIVSGIAEDEIPIVLASFGQGSNSIKSAEQGAAEGAPFIAAHIIEVTEKAFDDFAASGTDKSANRKILGLS